MTPWIASALAVLLGAGAFAQAQAPTFRATTSTVVVNVNVRRGNAVVANLTADDFRLTDNGAPQQIESVSIETMPIDVTLFLDTSGSTSGKRDEMQRDVQSVVTMLGRDDRLRMLTIGDAVEVALPWVPAGTTVTAKFPVVGGISLVNDALAFGLAHRAAPGRRHLVVGMTDRQDCGSAISASQVLELAGRTEAMLYLVDYSGGGDSVPYRVRSCTPRAAAGGVRIIDEAAARTGGMVRDQSFWFRAASIAKAFRTILADFRQSYVLRYSPAGTQVRGWHAVVVTVPAFPAATIRARQGYFVD
ncbi:MAG TPA: hypothetical protein VFV78_12740 [Vicinamibacterales bacterium]|nr:hypothetical protein [Vicinamibacterales bacterium]